jgi:hypothetical protein
MRLGVFLFVMALLPASLFAQVFGDGKDYDDDLDTPPLLRRNAGFLEVTNRLITFNYEYKLRDDLALRIGAGYGFDQSPTLRERLMIPITAHFLNDLFEREVKLELGAGILVGVGFRQDPNAFSTIQDTLLTNPPLINPINAQDAQQTTPSSLKFGILGYAGLRYESRRNGLLLRAGFLPILIESGLLGAASVSVGWRF